MTYACDDTSPEALAVQLECLRKMTPQERGQKALALSAELRHMAFAAIRRRYPELNEDEVQLRFIQLAYGQQLANEFASWRAEQSG